ncbi:hypothetical protein CesoFtcFv8_017709 [Champsocephalus esox]|uniref:MAP3K12-binding inhibitory protein 1 n=1 Tax=Champsocephalus esox TaxID=159716 RepID=A0AAN8GS10_9TELE|nr:hypothetical protein CesoFtcFv8_017709 [Champsocephalus esox]
MADTMKLSENHPPPRESSNMSSSYRDCLCAILKLFSDFGRELKLSDAALRIEVNVDAADLPSSPDAHVHSCLQEHITKLQAVSESLKTLVDAQGDTSSTKDVTTDDAVTSSSLREQMTDLSEFYPQTADDEDSKTAEDDVMVQIRAKKSEIERRISAFMERKQMEINENNVREFCNVIDCNQENSCARTDAVFTPYPGFKSHVKVTRVVNTYGPQTRSGGGQGRGRGSTEGPDVERLWKRSHRRATSEHRDSPETPHSGPCSSECVPEAEEAGGSDPGAGGTLPGVLSVHESPTQETEGVPCSGLQSDGAG